MVNGEIPFYWNGEVKKRNSDKECSDIQLVQARK